MKILIKTLKQGFTLTIQGKEYAAENRESIHKIIKAQALEGNIYNATQGEGTLVELDITITRK